jgi:hypothetical protein
MKRKLMLILAALVLVGSLTPAFAGDRSIIKVGHDAVVEVDMRVDDVVSVGGDVKVYGTVHGDAVSVGGDVYLGEDASVYGDVVAVGGAVYEDEGSVIHGDITEVDAFNIGRFHFQWPFHGFFWGFKIFTFIGCLALGLILAVLLPKQLDQVSDFIRDNPLTVILYGLLGFVLVIPILVILAISIVGIVLIPVELLAVVFGTLFGYYAVARIIGEKLSNALGKESVSILLALVFGLVVLGLVDIIPFFGDLVAVIAGIMGFGGVLMAIHKRKQ